MNIKQRDIWIISFYPNIGDEIGKTRPAVVVNDDMAGKLKVKTIVPITDWKDIYLHYPWMIEIKPNDINKLSKNSAIDCFQIKSLSQQRFVKKLGSVSFEELKGIHSTILKTLDKKYKIK